MNNTDGRAELSAGVDLPFEPEPRPSHAELLALIGEIDGIDLETEGHGIAVYLHIGDRKLRVIFDGGSLISHHITRTGIACCICRQTQ